MIPRRLRWGVAEPQLGRAHVQTGLFVVLGNKVGRMPYVTPSTTLYGYQVSQSSAFITTAAP